MRTVVTGGRKFSERRWLFHVLDAIVPDVTVIIHGDAEGADTFAKEWAINRGIPHVPFPILGEDWDRYGRRAGNIRNGFMLQNSNPDRVIAFPGGTGTGDCVAQASWMKIPVIKPDIREFIELVRRYG